MDCSFPSLKCTVFLRESTSSPCKFPRRTYIATQATLLWTYSNLSDLSTKISMLLDLLVQIFPYSKFNLPQLISPSFLYLFSSEGTVLHAWMNPRASPLIASLVITSSPVTSSIGPTFIRSADPYREPTTGQAAGIVTMVLADHPCPT